MALCTDQGQAKDAGVSVRDAAKAGARNNDASSVAHGAHGTTAAIGGRMTNDGKVEVVGITRVRGVLSFVVTQPEPQQERVCACRDEDLGIEIIDGGLDIPPSPSEDA